MRTVKKLDTPFALAAGLIVVLLAIVAVRASDDLQITDPVPTANPSNPPAAFEQPNRVAGNFELRRLAQGSDPIENPSGIITQFGLLHNAAKTKTEPDQNLYLVFDQEPGGPTPGYHYGHHFLFQGHENAANLAYVTRINLDVTDPAHRITLLTPVNPATGLTGFNSLDGATWDPPLHTSSRVRRCRRVVGSPRTGRRRCGPPTASRARRASRGSSWTTRAGGAGRDVGRLGQRGPRSI